MQNRNFWGAFFMLSIALLTTGAFAQRTQMSAADRAAMLKDSLSLSDEQKDSVVKIFQAMDSERRELFQSNSGDRQAMMEAMRGLTEKTDQKIEALLTPDQKTKYQELKKRRQERGQGRRRTN